VSWNLTSTETKNECIWIVGDLYEQQQQWCLHFGHCHMIQRHTVCLQTEIRRSRCWKYEDYRLLWRDTVWFLL